MNKILIALSVLMGINLYADELTDFIRQAEKTIEQEAQQQLIGLLDGSDQIVENGKCPRGGCLTNADFESESSPLMIFMSFSVPEASWKDLSAPLEALGGVFVLRGLPDNSFQCLATKLRHLREQGIKAPVLIDSKAFDCYHVQHVPTTVLVDRRFYDKVTGNLSLLESMRIFSSHGQSHVLAKTYLHRKW